MPKTCNHDGCTNPCFGGGYCRYHQYLRPKNPDKKPAAHKRSKRINAISERERQRQARYAAIRKEWLRDKLWCEARVDFNCLRQATEVHHKKGRIGNDLFDTNEWLAVCPYCHHWITEHSKEAIALGLSKSRLKQ